MTLIQTLQIFIYEMVDLIPNLILVLVAFDGNLRISKQMAFPMLGLVYLIVVGIRILSTFLQSGAAFLSVVTIFLYVIFFILCFRTELTKCLFVLLTILNYGSLLAILFSYCNYNKLSGFTTFPYSFDSTAALAFFYLITYPIMYKMMKDIVKPALCFPSNNRYWRFLWLVPATFCLSYYYNLFSNGGTAAFSQKLNNVIFAVFFIIGAIFVTYLVLKLIDESNSNMTLRKENDQLSLQSLQYEYLKNRMEDARRAKHDLRQSLTVIQSYVKDNDKEGLLKYIHQYIDSLPSDSPIHYCNNYALNALIVYYETLAQENHIQFYADVDFPDNLALRDADIIVLYGNMLENALEACMPVSNGEAYITFRIKQVFNMLVTTLDNSYFGEIHKTRDNFLSSKTNHTGLGIASIQNIAKKYNGIAKFEYDKQVFHVSVMLNLKDQKPNISK